MSEPHPQVQAAVDASNGLADAPPQDRVARLEEIAAKLEAALSENSG